MRCTLFGWGLCLALVMSDCSQPPPYQIQVLQIAVHSPGPVYDANIRNFAPVARIMKTALPDNAKIAKEAKECMQECVSEFISFITSEGVYSTHAFLAMEYSDIGELIYLV